MRGYRFKSGPRGYKINPGENKWPNPAQNKPVTWSIMGYSPDMPPELTEKTFRDAFRVWEKVADIQFEQLTDYTEDADIIIYFGEYRLGMHTVILNDASRYELVCIRDKSWRCMAV